MKIMKLEGNTVFIGTEDNRIVKVPIETLNFDDPQIGDIVKAFKGENNSIVIARDESKDILEEAAADNMTDITYKPESEEPRRLSQEAAQSVPAQTTSNEKRCNKHVFVWVCNFLFGYLGIDRFIRGQIGLGVIKLLTGGAIGVWSLVDFIISLVKAYGNAYGGEEDVVFINGKYTK